jgi:signal transduction histidine kinase
MPDLLANTSKNVIEFNVEYDTENESGRWDALREAALSGSVEHSPLDRLARIAAALMAAPTAVIVFADAARLVVTGRYGLPSQSASPGEATHEAPTAGSLCGCVLKTKRPLVLNNVSSHKRYKGLDAIKNISAFAFAGVPLLTSDLFLVGALCVLDTVERKWSRDEVAIFNDLARSAVNEIELCAAHHLSAKNARELELQSEHNLILRERQYQTEERLLHIGFDETARERAESARKQIESILEGITDGFFALDQSLRFTYINDRAEKLLHRSRGELIDTRLTDHPSPLNLVQRLKEVQLSKTPQAFEFNDESHGTSFEVLAYPSPTGISVYFHDVTARKKAVDEIQARSIELQALSRRLVEVQEQERGQIARELHDEVGQILTGLKLTLSAARRLPDAARDAQLDQAQLLVNELIGHVRDISLDLRPAMLDDLGLLPALLWHFERYTAQTGVEVKFSQTGITGRFEQAVETAAYRIVQEALTNVARYSQAKQACVRVHNVGNGLRIDIEDDGVGFEPEKAIRTGKSNGITGMRERVNLLRGVFGIESAPGEGAIIRARIPFSAETLCDTDSATMI